MSPPQGSRIAENSEIQAALDATPCFCGARRDQHAEVFLRGHREMRLMLCPGYATFTPKVVQ